MIILWIALGIIIGFAIVCGWVSYKIGKCLDRFDEFNFDEE